MQNKGYCAIQGHSGSARSVPIVCDFLLVINSNWHLISYHFEVIADCCLNFGHWVLEPSLGAYGQHILFVLGSLESV